MNYPTTKKPVLRPITLIKDRTTRPVMPALVQAPARRRAFIERPTRPVAPPTSVQKMNEWML